MLVEIETVLSRLTREVILVDASPILEREIALAFIRGKLGIDFEKR